MSAPSSQLQGTHRRVQGACVPCLSLRHQQEDLRDCSSNSLSSYRELPHMWTRVKLWTDLTSMLCRAPPL